MVIRNNDWYNANSTTHYPLDDNATGDSNDAGPLPSNILVDCHLSFPRLAGKFAFVSSVNITANLVSVTIGAVQSVAAEIDGAAAAADFTPIAVITVVNPEEYRPYQLEALYPGVGGWIVFGNGITEPYRADFTTPEQSFLTHKSARWYDGLPIASARKEGVADALTGLVHLKGSNTVSVTAETRTIGETADRRVIVISVDDNKGVITLADLVGPCGQRPETRNCPALPIEYINTVDPDCDGNITINFYGPVLTEYRLADGITLDVALGLADVCVTQECMPTSEGVLCNEYTLSSYSSISCSSVPFDGGW
jgi:hypothetical protein